MGPVVVVEIGVWKDPRRGMMGSRTVSGTNSMLKSMMGSEEISRVERDELASDEE